MPSGLFRPTATTPAASPADDPTPTPAESEGEGRGDEPATVPIEAPSRTRTRRKPAPANKSRSRNLHLSDDVHDRLWQLARQRRTTVSAVAEDLLNRALPRWEVRRQG